MGLVSGKISLTRYRLGGAPQVISTETLNKTFKKFRAKPLVLEHPKELAFGWDLPNSGFETEGFGSHWDLSHCAYDDGYLLRIRIEKRRVPQTLLTQLFRTKLAEMMAQGTEVKRHEKKELLEELKAELLAQALPDVKFIDAVWQTKRHEVFLLSSSKQACEIFEKLFIQSFSKPLDAMLVRVVPPFLGIKETSVAAKDKSHTKRLKGIINTIPAVFYTSQQIPS